jgi:hypothetical protein
VQEKAIPVLLNQNTELSTKKQEGKKAAFGFPLIQKN